MIKEYEYPIFPRRIMFRKTQTKRVPIAVLVNTVEKWDNLTMPIWWSYQHTTAHKEAIAGRKRTRRTGRG